MMTSKQFISPCSFVEDAAKLQFRSHDLVVCDQKVLRAYPRLEKKLKNSICYKVKGGESLKDIGAFPFHVDRILRRVSLVPKNKLRVVSVGGGSVGDFSGLLATLLFRGLPLIHVPSTWLAAVDSSHGGKTALNVGLAKNQLGSFWPAQRVYLCKDLLMGQPQALAADAYFEFFKMALLSEDQWGRNFVQKADSSPETLWRFLKPAIQEKYQFVKKDPYDDKGHRVYLNLGHSLGHAMELEYGLSHGLAVGMGLRFALWLSVQKHLMREDVASLLMEKLHLPSLKGMPINAHVFSLLRKDKKRRHAKKHNFVLLKDFGKPLVVSVDEKWLKRKWENEPF